MKKFNPANLVFGFFGLATFASLTGAISGSLAWYAYATRAALSYSGTSVQNTMQLQIGLMSSIRITNFTEEDQITETTFVDDSNFYYFAPAGVGLNSRVIGKYLSTNGYATNLLYPLTSGSFAPGLEAGNIFSLKEAPNVDNPYNDSDAKKGLYAKIPFIFRSLRNQASNDAYFANQEIWLTDAKTRASSDDEGDVYKSMRLYIEREESYTDGGFILNPSAVQGGFTKVGGLLDFGKDGYYDFNASINEEIIFGQYDELLAEAAISESVYADPDGGIVDVNGVGESLLEPTSFLARHQQGVKYYESLNNCGIGTAQYYALEDILPVQDGDTLRNVDPNHPSSVCITAGEEGHYIGLVTMTVYLEGWDYSLVDKNMNHLFDIGLTFEINAIRNS